MLFVCTQSLASVFCCFYCWLFCVILTGFEEQIKQVKLGGGNKEKWVRRVVIKVEPQPKSMSERGVTEKYGVSGGGAIERL